MADNVTLDAGSGGATLAAASLSISGDTAIVQMVGCGILSGSEGSWTHTQMAGGAGAVAAGVQRVTLASDDPAVTDLAAIEVLITAGNVDLAAIEVLLTAANVDHAANEVLLTTIAGDTTSLDGKVTACNTGAVVLSSGTVTTVSTVTNLAQMGGAAISMGEGVLGVGVQRVTLATDDDGVAHLATIAGDTTSIDGKITACNTGAVVLSSGTVTTVSTVTNLSQLGGAAINMGEGAISTGTQRVTIATDDDGVAHLATIAGAVSTEMQVDVVAALPAGTNAIGKLAANSGVDIGDTDVTSVVPGTAATNLGKARASALGATDTGVAPLAVRNDDLADLAGADGDYTPLQVDPEGALYVNPAAAEPKRDSGVAAGGAPGTDTMIAAPGASIKIRVLALGLFATSATTNNVFIDNVDNDLLFNTGNPLPLSIDADGDTVAGFVLPYNPGGWFETDAANEAVTLNTSAAQDIAWSITWIEVPG